MDQNLSGFSYQQLQQQLKQALNLVLAEPELVNFCSKAELQKPAAGKRF